MATITQNDIQFTLNAEAVTPFGGKYTNNQNFDASTGLYNINQTKLNNVGVLKSFNAVEIDWNGALVEENVTLNSTGDLLNWIKTKGGSGITPGPGPLNPDEPTDSSPSIETLAEEEFRRRLDCLTTGAECLEEGILYVIVNESGTIIEMYQIINGVGHHTYMPEPSLLKETGTTTLDNFNNLTDSEKASKDWIIIDENGKKIGIALEGVLLLDDTIKEAEVDGVGYKVMIVDSYPPEKVLSDILYLVKDNNGKITTSYLNGNEIELEKVNGLQKSDVTEMFKKDFVKDNQGNIIGLKHTGISIDKNGDGEIIESTEFNSYLNDYTNKAGFISNADDGKAFAELFATSSTKGKLKSSKIIAAINKDPQGGETSSVTISADKIDVDGIFDVKVVGDTGKTASELLVDANGLSSRVSGLDDDDNLVVSNFNTEKGEITLTTIMTPAQGNTAAQTASINLKVNSKDEGSKLTLTADQIELNGDETIANWISSKAVTTGTLEAAIANIHKINSNDVRTLVAGADYIYLKDSTLEKLENSSWFTGITNKGIIFGQPSYLNDISWALWSANLDTIFERNSKLTEKELILFLGGFLSINEQQNNIYGSSSKNIYGYGVKLSAPSGSSESGSLYIANDKGLAILHPTLGGVMTGEGFGIRIADNTKFNSAKNFVLYNANTTEPHLWLSKGATNSEPARSSYISTNGSYLNGNVEINGIVVADTFAARKYMDKDTVIELLSKSIYVPELPNLSNESSNSSSREIISFDDDNSSNNSLYSNSAGTWFYIGDGVKVPSNIMYTPSDGISFLNTVIKEYIDEESEIHYILFRNDSGANMLINNTVNFCTDIEDINTINTSIIPGIGVESNAITTKRLVIKDDVEESYNLGGVSIEYFKNDSAEEYTFGITLENGYGSSADYTNYKKIFRINNGFIDVPVYLDNSTIFRAGDDNKSFEIRTNGDWLGHPQYIINSTASSGLNIFSGLGSLGLTGYITYDISLTGSNINFNGLVNLSSDQNLKNIISDISLTVEQIANAPAINFSWKTDKNNNVHIGTTALYWQEILPEVVHENNEGTLGLEYSTTALVSSIIEAKEIVVLKSKVEELEAENNRLKIRLAQIEEKLGL